MNDTPLSPEAAADYVVRQFGYLLNDLEQASQSSRPAELGYAAKRQAVLGFVRDLALASVAAPSSSGAAAGEPTEGTTRDVLLAGLNSCGIEYDDFRDCWWCAAEPGPVECDTLEDAIRCFGRLVDEGSALRSASPVAAPDNDLVGGEGPAVPRSQYEAALKGSDCIEIYDSAIDDFRLYDVTTPEGIGAVIAELTGRMFRVAVEANFARAAVAAPTEDALAPFAHFARMWDANPIGGRKLSDEHVIYGIHTGTEWEANLTLGHFRAALRAAVAAPSEVECDAMLDAMNEGFTRDRAIVPVHEAMRLRAEAAEYDWQVAVDALRRILAVVDGSPGAVETGNAVAHARAVVFDAAVAAPGAEYPLCGKPIPGLPGLTCHNSMGHHGDCWASR
jgi:hypothetical protein